MTYIKQIKNEECNKAIIRIFPNIDIEKINYFIENISYISDIRKGFYKEIIKTRYEIVKSAYKKLKKAWQSMGNYSIIIFVTRRSQNFSPYLNKEKG